MKKINLLLIPFLAFCMAISACNKRGGNNSNVEVTGVSLDQTSLTMYENEQKELKATVTPDNATDKTVTWSSSNTAVATVSGGLVKALKEGNATITASAGNYNATCNVKVNKVVISKVLQAVRVTPPNKTTYYVGDQLDTTGLVVTAVYTDRSEERLTSDKYTVSGFDSSAPAANQTVTVSYTYENKTKSGTFNVTILEIPAPEVTGIEIESLPTKAEYEIGDQFESAGLSIKVTYSDGSTKIVNSGLSVSGFSSTTAGRVRVTVTYEGKSATFEVTIKQAQPMVTITGIEVTTKPTKLEYEIGEALDKTGMVVKAVMSDGTKEEFTGWTVSDLDSTTAGEKELTVTYVTAAGSSFTTTFKVTVLAAKELVSIALNVENAKTTYEYNEDLDTSGVVVTAHYDRGEDQTIAIANCTVTGYSKTTEGQQTITVTYGGQSKTYTVTVNAQPEQKVLASIAVTTKPTKLNYVVGEDLDTTGMVVTATYSDQSTKAVTPTSVTGYDKDTASTQTITVTYTEEGVTKTDTFEVVVSEQQPTKTLSNIAITTAPTKTTYYVGEELDATGMVVTATYSDDSTETIAISQLSITGFDSSAAIDEKIVTVTYEGKTATFTVKIEVAPVVYDDYIIRYKKGNADWAEAPMKVNPDNADEYILVNPIQLDVNDLFEFHMTGDDWRDYTDLKDGGSSAKFTKESDSSNKFKVLFEGDYQFFVNVDGSTASVWTERQNRITSLVATYGNGSEYAFVGSKLDVSKLNVHYEYDDGDPSANIAYLDTTGYYVLIENPLDIEHPTRYPVDGDTVIANNMLGEMKVYVHDSKEGGWTGADPYFTVTVVQATYYVVGVGNNWTIGQDGFLLTVDPNDKNHYTLDGVDVSGGDEIKVAEQNTEVFYGNNDANYHFDNAGTYNIDFYVSANNGIHIVASLAGPLSLSEDSVTITMGENPVVVTARNIDGELEIAGAAGSDAVATANLVGSTITITAVGAGQTTFTLSDDSNNVELSVRVYNAPQMYIASSENSWTPGLVGYQLTEDPQDSNHYQITDYVAAAGEKMKIVNTSTDHWQGNGAGDGEDFVINDAAVYTIDFYVQAQNDIHIVATKTHEILTLSSNSESLVVGGNAVITATKHNGALAAQLGYDDTVVDVDIVDNEITISALAVGSTTIVIGDQYSRTENIDVTVSAARTVQFTLDLDNEATNTVSFLYDINHSIANEWINHDAAWHDMQHVGGTKKYTYTLENVPDGANVRFMFATWTENKQDTFLLGFNDWKPASIEVNSNLYVHADGSFPEADTNEEKGSVFTYTYSTKVLSSIEVNISNAQLVFEKGDELVTTGLVVTANYNDSSSNTVALNSCLFTGYDPSEVESQTVTISYTENGVTKSVTYQVTVKLSLSSIAVTTNPTKTEYEIGDSFDSTGLVITATYTDGSSHTVAPTNVSNPDLSTAGSKTVTVTYTEDGITKTTTFVVTVAVTLTSIEITQDPSKTTYKVGEAFNSSGITVIAHYSDSSTSNVTANVEFSGFDSSAATNNQTITVSYNGQTDTFTVDIITLSSIAVTSDPTKTSYFVGDSVNTAGLVVTATYSDGSHEVVDGYQLSNPDMSSVGSKEITVTFSQCNLEKTATFNIEVVYETYLKGDFNEWEARQAYILSKVTYTTYRIVNVTIESGQKLKVFIPANSWYGCSANGAWYTVDGEGNLVITATGVYTINFDINAEGNNYVTLTRTDLYLSSSSETLVVGGDNVVVTPYNFDGLVAESGNEAVATVSTAGDVITITPVGKGTTTITVTDNSNVERTISVTVSGTKAIAINVGDWSTGNAVIFAWVWGTEVGGYWVKVTGSSITVLEGVDHIVLVRMPNGSESASWTRNDNQGNGGWWNRTADNGDYRVVQDGKVLTFSTWGGDDGISSFNWVNP